MKTNPETENAANAPRSPQGSTALYIVLQDDWISEWRQWLRTFIAEALQAQAAGATRSDPGNARTRHRRTRRSPTR
jgi:hypothetical protein